MTKLLSDLSDARAIIAKGFLFLLLGVLSASLVLVYAPNWRVGVCLWISIWAFCRFYYFAFYVIEHYVDDQYRYDGLISFFRYWLNHDKQD